MSANGNPTDRVLASMHTHSRRCDGAGTIADYARAACEAGLAAFGASGHAPLPFDCDYAMPLSDLDSYCGEVQTVAAEFEGRLPVYLGLELDFLPGLEDFYEREFRSRDFDYFVASVHYVGDTASDTWCYDESDEAFRRDIDRLHGGDARPVVEDYYRRIGLMARQVATWGKPVIVGHFDRIALWNATDCYFPTDDAWYRGLVETALDEIAATSCILEVNTSGWLKPLNHPNPDERILRLAARRQIPTIVSADAHRPSNIDFRFAEATRILDQAGCQEIVVPGTNLWRRVAVSRALS